MSIGKITRVALREVWRHEAADFSTWLVDNIDVLNDVLDFNLSSAEREQSAGAFSVDLVGEHEDGGTVVIENQLEKSDHDHLGKVLTYLAALDAKAAVWIVSQPRPEHIKAITWLNESTSTPFYLVKIEAIQIGDSEPAPLLTKIVGPSVEAQAAGATKKELSERSEIRRRFWTELLAYAKTKTNLHARISPGTYNWIGTGAGIGGLSWNYAIRQHETQVELYIDWGDEDDNKVIFDQLLASKESMEQTFGEPLEWQNLEGKRACRIRKTLSKGGWRDEDQWPTAIETTVDAMCRFEKALSPYVTSLKVG
ncbi:MAG: DUF4268 domain-containing protein [Dehalococcoidia bacterium]